MFLYFPEIYLSKISSSIKDNSTISNKENLMSIISKTIKSNTDINSIQINSILLKNCFDKEYTSPVYIQPGSQNDNKYNIFICQNQVRNEMILIGELRKSIFTYENKNVKNNRCLSLQTCYKSYSSRLSLINISNNHIKDFIVRCAFEEEIKKLSLSNKRIWAKGVEDFIQNKNSTLLSDDESNDYLDFIKRIESSYDLCINK